MPLERNLRPTRRQACAAPLTENEVPEQRLAIVDNVFG